MYLLEDFENIVKKKFIESDVIDYKSNLSEYETVKKFKENLKSEGIQISNLKEIPLLFYLIKYSDDEKNLKMMNIKKSDVMQTSRLTLLTLRGDCEDIHRMFNVASLEYVNKEQIKLLIIFFGNDKGLIGGHATSLVMNNNLCINLDYGFYVSSSNLNGILSYLSDSYFDVYSYVLLNIDNIKDNITYKIEKSGYFDKSNRNEYNLQLIRPTKELLILRNKLYRNNEYENNKKIYKYLALAGAGFIIGRILF